MPTRSRTASRPARRRDPYAAVLDAAAAILAEGGYGAFTIEAVARRSGAGKTTVYRRWSTKAELFIDLYNRESDTLIPVEDLGSLQDELNTEIGRIWTFWRETANGPAFRALVAEAQADPATMALFRTQFLPRARDFARAILARAIARGEADPELNVEAAIDLLFGFVIYHLIVDDITDRPAAIHQAVDLFVHGVGSVGGGARRPRSSSEPAATTRRYVPSR